MTHFTHEAPALYTFLVEASKWSDFANSLVAAWENYGSLTPRQEAAARSMMEKCSKKAEPKAQIDMTPIHAMFDKALANGLNKLAYRAEGLVISPAKATSRNAGALYVKLSKRNPAFVPSADNAYQGKLMNGVWHPVGSVSETTLAALRYIAADPSKAAQEYGKKTGECSCCGRELTDPVSVAKGIGPICAEKWGL